MLVPPALKKGKGIPVLGAKPVTTAMFNAACTKIKAVIPVASKVPKRSSQKNGDSYSPPKKHTK